MYSTNDARRKIFRVVLHQLAYGALFVVLADFLTSWLIVKLPLVPGQFDEYLPL
jgi:hypothetical protein